MKLKQIDNINPCRKQSKIVKQSCQDLGYEKYLGPDPIFPKSDLYVPKLLEMAFKTLSQFQGASTDDACWKSFSMRGIGKLPSHGNCSEGLEESMGLCYPPCASNFTPEGPVCWSKCSGEYTLSVGVLCCKDKTCEKELAEVSAKISLDIAKIVKDSSTSNAFGLIKDLIKLYQDSKNLGYPKCPLPKSPFLRYFTAE